MSHHNGDGWTIETLRVHLQTQQDDLRRWLADRDALNEMAAERQRKDYDQRFKSVNEFREQQADVIARFLTRAEYNAAHAALEQQVATLTGRNSERISDLVSRLDQMQGQDLGTATEEANRRARFNQIVAVIAVVATIAALAFAAYKR